MAVFPFEIKLITNSKSFLEQFTNVDPVYNIYSIVNQLAFYDTTGKWSFFFDHNAEVLLFVFDKSLTKIINNLYQEFPEMKKWTYNSVDEYIKFIDTIGLSSIVKR
ncbi:MAG: hypothetical protein EOO89_01530 [Pedobacter sp.]|nr:MAG: hypothetical protein EOO89_01530 [Pedobacter sp.]